LAFIFIEWFGVLGVEYSTHYVGVPPIGSAKQSDGDEEEHQPGDESTGPESEEQKENPCQQRCDGWQVVPVVGEGDAEDHGFKSVEV
jgi:hypothetical protein